MEANYLVLHIVNNNETVKTQLAFNKDDAHEHANAEVRKFMDDCDPVVGFRILNEEEIDRYDYVLESNERHSIIIVPA